MEEDGRTEAPKLRGSVSGLVWTVLVLTILNIAFWALSAISQPRTIPSIPRFLVATEAGPFSFLVLGLPHRGGRVVYACSKAVVLIGLAVLPLWFRARGCVRVFVVVVGRASLVYWFISGVALCRPV